jgi:predicted phosphoribosyltransferase
LGVETAPNLVEIQPLHDRMRVFADRAHAGRLLAGMLASYRNSNAVVLAIPAGGVPVAAVIARELMLPPESANAPSLARGPRLHPVVDVAVVSKITLPWNSEAGFGAVAFDGSACLNQLLIDKLSLGEAANRPSLACSPRLAPIGEEDIREGIDRTRHKVMRRVQRFRGNRPFPVSASTPVIVVDDGLASGYTILAAIEALRKAGARLIVVAVPTGQVDSVRRIAGEVDALYCANVRERRQFAAADAYLSWSDVEEDTAPGMLQREPKQTAATATGT